MGRVSGSVLALLLMPAAAADAGGSFYGIQPGARSAIAGKITEWSVPTPRFARDPAPAPDGSIWITVMDADKLARFDQATKQFKEYDLPRGSRPHGLLVDSAGRVRYTGHGNGKMGRLDPATGQTKGYALPAGAGAGPYAVTVDGAGLVWVNEFSADTIVRLDPRREEFRVFKIPTAGAGVRKMIVDAQGRLWYMGSGSGKLGVIE